MANPKVELLPSNTIDFTSGLIGTVLDGDVLSCDVIEELNGQYELEMRYPIDGENFPDIGYRSILFVKPNPYDDPEPFRIYRIVPNAESRIATIHAQHLSYDLAGIVTTPFTANSATSAFANMVSHSVTTCPFTFTSNVQTTAQMAPKTPMSIRKLQGGVEGSVIDCFGGEYSYHRWAVSHLSRRGADRGSEIRYGKNLKTLEQEKNCANVYTAILPYYYDDENGLVQGNLYNVSGTFDFVRVLDLDCTEGFDEPPTVQQLADYAASYASANGVGVPDVSLKIDFVMLENTSEYKDAIALADRVFLGDTVGVYFEKMGVDVTARVIRLEYDALADKYINVEIGKVKSNILTTVSETAQVVQNIPQVVGSVVDGAVERATANITGKISGNIHFVYDENGKPVELMILDTDDPETATQVWRWNMNGLGYSGTGIEGPYTLAIVNNVETGTGEIVADFITAGQLNGSVVETGTIVMDALNADVKSYIEAVKNGIEISVESQTNALKENLEGQITTQVSGVSDELDSLKGSVNASNQANASEIATLKSHVNITSEGIKLVVDQQDYAMWIKPDGVYISTAAGDPICKFTADGVLLPMDTKIPQGGTFTIGNFRWMPRESGNLSMVYVG